MIILGLPDIHGDTETLKKLKAEIKSADLVIMLGDITNFGRRPEMKAMISWIQDLNSQCVAVPGNCDFPETEQELDRLGVNLNGRFKILEGKAFTGLGASLPTPSQGTPFEVSEAYLSKNLERSLVGLDHKLPKILISHQPPLNTKADRVAPGLHVGSQSVRLFIEKVQPLLCFTGHIHEGQGIDQIGRTQIINPGPVFKGFYAYAEISSVVETLEIRAINRTV